MSLDDDSKKARQKIMQVKHMLNGKDRSGNKTSLYSEIKHLRYYAVLDYAMNSSIYKNESKTVNEKNFFNVYRLEKVANTLDLDFDKSRIAKKVFEDGEKRGEIEFLREDHREYVRLTPKGIDTLNEGLDELKSLQSLPSSTESDVIKQKSEESKMYYLTLKTIPVTPPRTPEVNAFLKTLSKISRFIQTD